MCCGISPPARCLIEIDLANLFRIFESTNSSYLVVEPPYEVHGTSPSAGLTGITARQPVVNCQGHEGRTGNFSALVHGSNANRYVLKMFIAID